MRQIKIANKITNRESLALEKYLTDIGKIPMITTDDEIRLAQEIRAGSQDAIEKLTSANLRFVVSVAKQYQNQGLSLSDLINEGNVGLMKAAKRFDETRGFKFISYAVWWIRQSILQAIVEHSRIVRMPINKVSSYNKVNEAWIHFVQQNEREPSDEELADILEIAPKDVNNALRGTHRYISFDAPLLSSEDGDSTMLDVYVGESDGLEADVNVMTQSLKDEISNGLALLAPREMEVIASYYGLSGYKSMSLEEIGDHYGLTRERVRQIKERAIRRLRKIKSEQLKAYLG